MSLEGNIKMNRDRPIFGYRLNGQVVGSSACTRPFSLPKHIHNYISHHAHEHPSR